MTQSTRPALPAQRSLWVTSIAEVIRATPGISCAFGLVSCCQSDHSALALGVCNAFMILIQQHLSLHLQYTLFGNLIYHSNLNCTRAYYWVVPPQVLMPKEVIINTSFCASRVPIEHNYALNSCIHRLLATCCANCLSREYPYALEQLCVCQLLLNCYTCLNSNQDGHVNTYVCAPPTFK